MKTKAAIAQLVEHFIRNEKVVGSSPTRGSIKAVLVYRAAFPIKSNTL